MRPVTVTVNGVGVSPVIPVDIYLDGGIGMMVRVGTGTTFKVEHTFDDVFSPTFNPATAAWIDHPTLAGTASSSRRCWRRTGSRRPA